VVRSFSFAAQELGAQRCRASLVAERGAPSSPPHGPHLAVTTPFPPARLTLSGPAPYEGVMHRPTRVQNAPPPGGPVGDIRPGRNGSPASLTDREARPSTRAQAIKNWAATTPIAPAVTPAPVDGEWPVPAAFRDLGAEAIVVVVGFFFLLCSFQASSRLSMDRGGRTRAGCRCLRTETGLRQIQTLNEGGGGRAIATQPVTATATSAPPARPPRGNLVCRRDGSCDGQRRRR
jgi:hypothetical protein